MRVLTSSEKHDVSGAGVPLVILSTLTGTLIGGCIASSAFITSLKSMGDISMGCAFLLPLVTGVGSGVGLVAGFSTGMIVTAIQNAYAEVPSVPNITTSSHVELLYTK